MRRSRTRVHKRYINKDKPRYKHNPPLFTDIVEFVVPGFGAFAGTRLLTRVVASQVGQRAPSWGKHAGAVASVASFAAAWLLGHKVKWLERWHTPIVVGSAIAALQSLIQLYIPGLGWAVSDATASLPSATSQAALTAQAQDQALAQMHLQPTNEDPNEFMYNDSYDGGRYSGAGGPQSMKTGMPPLNNHGAVPPTQQQQPDASDLAIDDAIGTANLGVFNAN